MYFYVLLYILLCITTAVGITMHYYVLVCITVFYCVLLLRGTIVNRTYGTHKNLYIYLFSLTIFGPVYYDPP